MILNENNIHETLDGLAADGEDLGDLICWIFDYATDVDSSVQYRSQVLERIRTYLKSAPDMAAHWKSCVEEKP